jgi:hypothetical protein
MGRIFSRDLRNEKKVKAQIYILCDPENLWNTLKKGRRGCTRTEEVVWSKDEGKTGC